MERGLQLKSRNWRHALDGEADAGKVNAAAEELFADHFHDFGRGATMPGQCRLIGANEAAVVASLRAFAVSSELRWLVLQSFFLELLSTLLKVELGLVRRFFLRLLLVVLEELKGQFLQLFLYVDELFRKLLLLNLV